LVEQPTKELLSVRNQLSQNGGKSTSFSKEANALASIVKRVN
jgi:hypothetical protein